MELVLSFIEVFPMQMEGVRLVVNKGLSNHFQVSGVYNESTVNAKYTSEHCVVVSPRSTTLLHSAPWQSLATDLVPLMSAANRSDLLR